MPVIDLVIDFVVVHEAEIQVFHYLDCAWALSFSVTGRAARGYQSLEELLLTLEKSPLDSTLAGLEEEGLKAAVQSFQNQAAMLGLMRDQIQYSMVYSDFAGPGKVA